MLAPSAAVYKKWLLFVYDFYVLKFSNTFAWRCSSSLIVQLYNKHISSKHLDIGVGTGYFLDKCQFPRPNPKITLLDLNPNCLEIASKRIARYQPYTNRADVFQPLPLGNERFDSVGLNYLFHCLPGPFSNKAIVFKNIQPFLNPGATVFGSTILGNKANNALAKKLLRLYNSKGIFGNEQDTREELEAALSQNFSSHSVWEVGSVAFFVGKK